MNTLKGIPWQFSHFSGLEKVRDLMYFDGPLLTHFQNRHGEDFLFYWVDCNATLNRWMVVRLDEASILRLVNRVVPIDFVIPKLCRDEFVVFIDTADNHATRASTLVAIQDIPQEYLPSEGAYLPEIPSLPSERSYSVLVEGGWSVKEWGEFPHVFTKVYSLLYGLDVLHLPRLKTYPWRGGFSAMHFFDRAAKRIPSEDRPSVSAIQYASPGFMRFDLHGPTADQVGVCIANYKSNNHSLAAAFAELTTYIREHRLNDEVSLDDSKWQSHAAALTKGALAVLGGFDVIEEKAFVKACARPFEAAKIAMAFYRYIRILAEFEKRRLVIFPAPPSLALAKTVSAESVSESSVSVTELEQLSPPMPSDRE